MTHPRPMRSLLAVLLAVALPLAGCAGLDTSTAPAGTASEGSGPFAGPATPAPPATPVVEGPVTPLQQGGPPALRFAPFRVVDDEVGGREPYLAIDPDGRLFVSGHPAEGAFPGVSPLWRSEDGGASWQRLDVALPTLPNGDPLAGGDSTVSVGPKGEVYVTDLWLGVTVSASHDHGETWESTALGAVPPHDRQWSAVDAKGRVHVLARDYLPGGSARAYRSDDGGKSFQPTGSVFTPADSRAATTLMGPLSVHPRTDALLLAYGCFDGADGAQAAFGFLGDSTAICTATSADGGATWTHRTALVRGVPTTAIWPILAADAEGGHHLAWAERHGERARVFHAWSADGMEWGEPRQVSPERGIHFFPWLVAGGEGRVAVAWYGTDAEGDNNDDAAMKDAEWHAYVAQGVGVASGGNATWDLARASHESVHRGTISTTGIPLTAPGKKNPDRSLGDFLTMAVDPEGRLHLAFTVSTQDDGPRVAHAVQEAGPTMWG